MKNKDPDQVLLNAIQGLRTEIGRIDRDLGADRQSLESMAMEVANFKQKQDQFSKQLDSIQSRIQDKVADAIEPTRVETARLSNTLEGIKTKPKYMKLLDRLLKKRN